MNRCWRGADHPGAAIVVVHPERFPGGGGGLEPRKGAIPKVHPRLVSWSTWVGRAVFQGHARIHEMDLMTSEGARDTRTNDPPLSLLVTLAATGVDPFYSPFIRDPHGDFFF